ncbi:hypothetical protein HDU76_007012, partial [Blyttiomyces sp. JEL0837]
MQLVSIFATLAALATTALASTCDKQQDGKLCFGDCKGNGIYMTSPPIITGITIPVDLKIPDSLAGVDMAFTGAGAQIGVGIPGQPPVARMIVPDYVNAYGNTTSKVVYLDMDKVVFAGLDPVGFAKMFQLITLMPGPVPLGLSGYADNKATVTQGSGSFAAAAHNLPNLGHLEAVPAQGRGSGLRQNMFIVRDDTNAPLPTSAEVCLQYIGFQVTSALTGFGGLTQTKIVALPVIKGGSPTTGVQLEIQLEITNPSTIGLNLNTDVTMQILYKGQAVGTVVLPNFVLNPNSVNKITAVSYVNPDKSNADAVAATRELFSHFTGGVDTNINVGKGAAAGLHALDLALGSLNIPQVLPSNKKPLII